MTCKHGHDLTKPDSTYADGSKKGRCRRCHQDSRNRYYQKSKNTVHIDPWIKEWAQIVWDNWTPHERAEFSGALELILDRVRGAADATDARKRRHTGRPDP